MDNKSKPLFKMEEDTCKAFAHECLQGDPIHAVDIDTLYNIDGIWYIFEYLRCDSEYVTPHTSDPSKYPFNWKKFHALYQAAKALNGKLILINYSVRDKDKDQVRVMFVKKLLYEVIYTFQGMDFSTLKTQRTPYIEYEQEFRWTKKQFSDWLRKLNSSAKPLPFQE